MPDFFSNLNATGIGQVPTSSNIAPLPQIDFSELPTYIPNTGGVNSSNSMGQSITGDPFKMNFNPTDFSARLAPSTVDTRELEKYANSSAFKTLGYNKRESSDDRENAYDQEQPWYEATGNALAKFGDKTWSSFTGFFRQNIDTFDALRKLDIQDAWKTNANLANLEHDEDMEKLFPSFKSAVGKRWYSFIPGTTGSGDFYEDFVPQLGFTVGMMAGAIAENVMVDFLTGGIGAGAEALNSARKIYGAITGFTNLKRGVQLARGLTNGNAVINGLKIGANGWAFFNTAASEAAMEGAQNYNETKKTLIEQYKLENGYAPIGEDLKAIENSSTSAGNRTFGMNVPLLSISNAIQFQNILLPQWAKQKALKEGMMGYELINQGGKLESKWAAQKIARESFSEAWKAGNALTRTKMLGSFLTSPKLAFLTEGFEESSQRAVSSTNKDYAIDQIYGDADYTKSIKYGLSDMFTAEGVQEFIGGALGGLVFQGAGHIASKFATPKTTINDQGNEETKFNFLNKIGIFSEKYKDTKREAYAQQVAEAINHDALKDVLKDGGFRDLVLSGRNGEQMKKYLEKNDIFNFRNMKSDALNRFFYSALKYGKIDLRIGQLADFTSLTDDEFKQALDIDQVTPEAKESLLAIREYLEAKAATFEDIYNREGTRFDSHMNLANNRYNKAAKDYGQHLDTLKVKYGSDDPEEIFKDLNDARIELNKKYEDAEKIADEDNRNSTIEKLDEDAEQFVKDNEEKILEQAKLHQLNAFQNVALMDYAAVEEGKKAALFAYSDMIDSADRSREILASLKEQSNGIRYSEVENLLDKTNTKKTLDRFKGYVKSLNLGQLDAKQKEQLKSYEKRVAILENLLNEYNVAAKTKTITAAELIHEFLLSEPSLQTTKAYSEWDYNDDKRNRDLTRLSDLVQLQKRNQENLNLYNRLVSPALSGHTEAVSKLVKDFIQRAYEYHKKGIEAKKTSQATQSTPASPATTPIAPISTSTTTTSPDTTSPTDTVEPIATEQTESEQPSALDEQVDGLLARVQNNQPLTDEEFNMLETLAALNENAAKAYEMEKARRDALAPLEQPPVVIEELPDNSTIIELEPNSFVPIEDISTGPEISYENTQASEHSNTNSNPLRTTVNETLNRFDDNPTIDPRTQFRQKFLDKLAQESSLGDYRGVIELDSINNYEPGSKEHGWLLKHPNDLSIVLKIVDLNNRETFDEDYNPSTNGKKILFSLNNSMANKELAALMRQKGLTQIPNIELTRVSPGVWDKGKMRPTSELVEGISKNDYRLEVAKSPMKGDPIAYSANGYPLVNGGFYLNSRDAFAKLLPQTVDNIKVEGQVRDLLGIFDLKFTDGQLANSVGKFLSDMLLFGQDEEFGDPMRFIVLREKGGKFSISGFFRDAEGHPLMQTTEAIKAYLLKTQKGTIRRINVSDGMLYSNIEFYYAENGELKSIKDVDYNSFILNNTSTNKKDYRLNGRKIVKSVNRYLEISDVFKDAKKTLQAAPTISQPIVTQSEQQEENEEQPGLPKFDKTTMIGEIIPVLKAFDFNNPNALPGITNLLKQLSSSITQEEIDKAVAARSFNKISIMLVKELAKPAEQQAASTQQATQLTPEQDIERRRTEERGEALEKLGIDKFDPANKVRSAWQEARDYSLDSAINQAKKTASSNPNTKIGSLPQNAANAIRAELSKIGITTTDNTSLSEIISSLDNIKNTYDAELAALKPQTPEQKTEELSQDAILPTSRKSRKLKEEEDDLNEALDRRKDKALREVMGEEEVKFVLDRFGEAAIRHLKNIVDAGAWGTWMNGVITLYSDAPAGTAYHEAWHHFSQMYLPKEDKVKLYTELRSKLPALRNASNKDVEEYIAEDFRKFKESGGKIILESRPFRNNIFTRILDFIRTILGMGPRLGKLYAQLNTGDFQSYTPNINNAMFGRLDSRVKNIKGEELLPASKVTRYLRFMDSLIGQFIAHKKISFAHFGIKKGDLASKTVAAARIFVYNRIEEARERIAQEEVNHVESTGKNSVKKSVVDDLDIILDNFNDVFKSYIKLSDFDLNKLSEKDLDKAFAVTEDNDEGDIGVEDDVTEGERKEVQNSDKVWDIGGNEISLINDASSQTKSLIRTLSKVQVDATGAPRIENGKVVLATNEYGLEEPVDFSQVFNNLGILLEGSYNEEEMIEKMQDINNQRRLPELALLLERMPKLNEIDNYAKLESWISFFQDFSKVYIPIYSLLKMKDGTFRFIEETKNSRKQIEKQWTNNFFNISPESDLIKNGDVLYDEHTRPYVNKDLVLDLNMKRDEDRERLFSLLGMTFSPLARASDEFKSATSEKWMNILLNTFKARLKAGQTMYNPYKELSTEYAKIKGESKTINALLDIEAKYSNVSPSMSFRNAEGQMQYGLSLNMYLTSTNYWLSRTKSYKDIMNNASSQHLNIFNNPYIKNSLFLNSMFNLDTQSEGFGKRKSNGNPIVIQLGNYNGLKYEDTSLRASSTTSLGVRDKIIMDMNSLLTQGAVEIMRTESSASAFFVKLSNYTDKADSKQNLPFTIKDIGSDINRKALRDRMVLYFEDEINTILNKYNSPLPNYYGTKTSPGRFAAFNEVLGGEKSPLRKEIETELQKYLADTTRTPEETQAITNKILEKFGQRVAMASITYFGKMADELTVYLASKEVNFNDMSKKYEEDEEGRQYTFKELINTFVVNDYILNTEFSKLFSGNVAYYKAYHKRSKGDISTGRRALVSQALQNYLNNTKHKTLAYALGVTSDINTAETKTITITDDIRASVNYEDLIQGIMDTSNVDRKKAEKMLGTTYKPDGTIATESAYLNMNVADGQGHTTLDFYRQFRISVGNWTYDDDQAYEREVIGYKLRKNLYENEEARKKDEARLETLGTKQVYWPPIKMQHNGPLKMKGAHAPVLDKFSIAPLIPSMIKDSVWDIVHDKMIKEGISYSKMESGSKKYQFPSINLYDDNWTPTLDITQDKVATVFSENLKEQIATHGQIKKESTWGTQMRKLFMANLFSLGRSNSKFEAILDNYKTIMGRMMESEREGLYREFGITANKETGVLTIKDSKRFIETLQEAAASRKLNDNILDSIKYDPTTGKPMHFLEINLNRPAIEDMINGMIYNRLTRIKLNGDMLIQVASTGFESKYFKYTKATKEDYAKYGTNGLSFYRVEKDKNGKAVRTSSMGVKVALAGEWLKLLKAKHPDGQVIGTRERLNELLKDEQWSRDNEKRLTMIGYRIPTQGINSMEFMQVREFLPTIAGSIIILPAEIVAKAGSDYDIDKLNIFRPSMDENGNYITDDTFNKNEQSLTKINAALAKITEANEAAARFMSRIINSNRETEEGKQEDDMFDPSEIDDSQDINEEEKRLLNRFYELNSSKKPYYTNKLIEIYHEVLSSPEMFTQLVTPNNTNLITPTANYLIKLYGLRIDDYKNGEILEYLSNLNKFDQLTSGKNSLGSFALANNMSQLLQQSGMTINSTYKLRKSAGYSKDTEQNMYTELDRKVNLLLLSPEERQTVVTMGEDGLRFSIDYSSARDVEGELKQEFFSQLINATVDIASNPYFVAFGINGDNISLVVHAINLGIPFSRVIMFINQPIIKRYNAMLEKGVRKDIAQKTLMFPGEKNPKGIKSPRLLAEMEILESSQGDGFYFSTKALHKVVEGAGKEYLSYAQTAKGNDARFQLVAFAHYLKLQEQADLLSDLQQSSNFDTKKFLSGISIEANLRLRDRVKKAALFNAQAVDDILNDSLISSFNNLEETKDILYTVMPIANQKSFLTAGAEVLEEYRGTEGIRLERTLVNDWIEFLVKNYGMVDGMNFEDYSLPLIQGIDTLAQTLYALKNKYPELKSYRLVSLLYPNYSGKVTDKKNVELYRNLDNTTDFQNVLIENYNRLLNFKGTEIPGKTYTPEQVAEIRDFFEKLQYASFQQSGFNKSPISSIDIVPYQTMARVMQGAMEGYIKAWKTDSSTSVRDVKEFIHLFKRENYKFKLTDNPNQNKEPFRGKTYKKGSTGENHLPIQGSIEPTEDLPMTGDEYSGDEDYNDLLGCLI